jgi:Membrane bound O-acyl transferase family
MPRISQDAGRKTSRSSDSPPTFTGWVPLLALVPVALGLGRSLPSWGYMWSIAFAIFLGVKWQTWWRARGNGPHSVGRSVAYLFLWPGMDASAFLSGSRPHKPAWAAWCWAFFKASIGAALLWFIARQVPSSLPLVRGWVGLLGLAFLLHFGCFDLIALGWQSLGVRAEPIMRRPTSSRSLAEFWGRRWNLGFRQLSHDFVFRPLYSRVGLLSATLLVFLVSGLIRELVISVPARGGYGLPTAYFILQGLGVIFERSRGARFPGLGHGVLGWAFTALVTAGPVYFLFHPPFVLRVVLPFMKAIRARWSRAFRNPHRQFSGARTP